MKRIWCIVALFLASWTLPITGQSQCVGDCDGDGAVEISELIQAVRIALGESDPNVCRVGDSNRNGSIEASEVIGAVNAALKGCPTVEPTPHNVLILNSGAS